MHTSFILGGDGQLQYPFYPHMANSPGLITGDPESGKKLTTQVLAENLALLGIPVLLTDIKEELSGLARPGEMTDDIRKRMHRSGTQLGFRAAAVELWDIFKQRGHDIRINVSTLGPHLLAWMLELNPSQSSVLASAFKIASDQKLELIDLQDMHHVLDWMGKYYRRLQADYGAISSASINAIQRKLLFFTEVDGELMFGDPEIRISSFLNRRLDGRGIIHIIDALTLYPKAPKLYSSLMLWILFTLYTELPEVKQAAVPEAVLFIDEAHELFNGLPEELAKQVERVIRGLKNKGIGLFFITTRPLEIPDKIRALTKCRIIHSIQNDKGKNKQFLSETAAKLDSKNQQDIINTIKSLETGQILVACCDQYGNPRKVQKIFITPPASRIGALSSKEREDVIKRSRMQARYAPPNPGTPVWQGLNEEPPKPGDDPKKKSKQKKAVKKKVSRKKKSETITPDKDIQEATDQIEETNDIPGLSKRLIKKLFRKK